MTTRQVYLTYEALNFWWISVISRTKFSMCVIEYPIQSWNIQNCFDKCVRTLDKQCYAMHVQSLWFWGFGYLLPISSSSKLRFGDAAGNIWWLLLFKEGGASWRTFEGVLLKSTLMQITDHRFHDDCSSCWSDNSTYKWQIVPTDIDLKSKMFL